jgi:hypothetical protein
MRTSRKYIAAFFGACSLLICLLQLPDWPSGSPPERITAAVARAADGIHTPFMVVRQYKLNLGYTAPLVRYSTR